MKHGVQLIFVISLIFSLIPQRHQNVSAQDVSASDLPVSFEVENQDENSIEIVVSAPSFQINEIQIEGETFDSVSIADTPNKSVPGEPQLPSASKLIGVPPLAEVSIEILEDASRELDGEYRIPNAPYPFIKDEFDTTQRWDYDIQLPARSSAQISPVKIAEEAWIRDQRVIRLQYTPFDFNPKTGILKWHPVVRIRIHFEYPAGRTPIHEIISENTAADAALDSFLSDALLNYDQAAQWRDISAVNSLVSPPNVGSRYRIAIDEDGIYKLTYETLYATNAAIAGADSSLLHMTSQGQDVAIQIVDGNGTFGPGDYIIFYGQKFYGDLLADLYQDENMYWANFVEQKTDGSYQVWKPEFNAIMMEKYTRENVYWLYEGTDPGLRMSTVDGDPSSNSDSPMPYYRDTVHAEKSNEWKTTLFTGEDSWFWTRMTSANTTYNYTTTLSALSPSGFDPVVRAEFVSEFYNLNTGDDHHTEIRINGNLINDEFWTGKSRYHLEETIDSAFLTEGTNTLGFVARNDAQVTNPRIFFDWFEIEYNRLFEATGNAITFSNTDTGIQKYQVDGFGDTNGLQVLDISHSLTPTLVLSPTTGGGQVTISLDNTSPLTVTMDGNPGSIPSAQVSYYTPPDWAAMASSVDYVYITHADFLAATQDLADYRASHSGLSTQVIDIQDLYNEFNFGIYNPIAIKNFLAYTFDEWQTPPTYTLLVGDGHWNFMEYRPTYYIPTGQYIPPNLTWVDPWQGEVDSANLLANVVGDDPIADVLIARLPVNSSAEIDAYRDKLTTYEDAGPPEPWESIHVFVADQADDSGNFPANAEEVIDQYVVPAPFAEEVRIYEDDYGCTDHVACPAVNAAIVDTLNNSGALILNFLGHASVNRWSHEQIFLLSDLPNLQNADKLPVILSMDCLDGFWSGPGGYPGTSIIEEVVRQSENGAIAAFSPTGLGISTGHDILHKGFYESLMVDNNWELGSAALNAKLQLFNVGIHPDLLHTYTIFGDPALQIRHSNSIYLPLTIK